VDVLQNATEGLKYYYNDLRNGKCSGDLVLEMFVTLFDKITRELGKRLI
jgi:hypothetical protein